MRFEKLQMQNFGPYENETVDFTAFADRPLFLITGDTGAGKSTIFDALLFALYGSDSKSSNGNQGRVALGLRSDFAASKDETVVSLQFSHQGQQYSVRRAIRVRKTGELVPRDPELTVTAADGTQHVVTKNREVNAALLDLLQLDKAQFRQIILLPQGDFRRFLDASSKEREELLRNIFGTDLYQRWQNNIEEHRRQLKRRLESTSNKLEGVIGTYALDAGQELADGELSAQLDQLRGFLQADKAKLAAQAAALTKAQAAATAAVAAQTQGQQLAANFARLDTLRQQQAELKQAADQQAARTQQIAELEWVSKHAELSTRLARARANSAAAQTQLAQLQDQLQQATAGNAQLRTQLAELQVQQADMDAAAARIKQIDQTLEQLEQLAQLERVAQTAQAELTARQQALGQIKATLAKLTAEQTQTQTALSTNQAEALATATAAQQLVLSQQQTLLKTYKNADRAVTAAVAKEQVAQKQASTTATAAQTATRDYKLLQMQYYSAQAAVLAADLQVDQPCPVCGSRDHPHPASAAAQAVDQSTLDAAAQAADVATKQGERAAVLADSANKELSTAKQQLEAAANDLLSAYKDTTVFGAIPAVVDLNTAVSGIAANAKQLQQNTAALQLAQTQRQNLQQRTAELSAQIAQTRMELDSAQAVLTTAQAKQAAAAQAVTSLRAARSAAELDEKQLRQTRADLLQTTTTYQQQLRKISADQQAAQDQEQQLHGQVQVQATATKQAQQEVAQLTASFNGLLQEHFGSADEQRFATELARLPELPDLQQQQQDYLDRVGSIKKQLADAQTLTTGRTRPDVPALTAAADAARQQSDALTEQYGGMRTRTERNAAVVQQVATELQGWAQDERDYRALATLLGAFNGNNERNLGLERYVLGSYFARVLEIASDRFHTLTRGRYRFLLNTGGDVKISSRTGLEIDVYDDQVGGVRSVHTLSGGESFIAALCLALALGEVIQEESGGISIDALFIDEGFGSLDRKSLDLAMAALESIEGNNRMIGVISHVTEMKHSIPDQLQVIPDGTGRSHLQVRHGAE
ncbi:AAA family ATPase [Lacticaseibacillus zhaodongensis]|uniref:AAA family ATPase n=1 Tax=Lacticaseibacillus zhaodongensis TaxID=2668065 RepID=UPI0012D2A964|nr:SMC family ATPase [Lacticaseibacillus zhaodongensis]